MSDLQRTFDAYVAAASEAGRVFCEYRFLRATEQAVWAANERERYARNAHLAAIATHLGAAS